ncbi:MAG: hypothetical protein AAF318_04565 [Pseudomonadota bacterium]
MLDGRDLHARVAEADPASVVLRAAHTPSAIDRELQAAIEYKIASAGVGGAELVLDLLNHALKRVAA